MSDPKTPWVLIDFRNSKSYLFIELEPPHRARSSRTVPKENHVLDLSHPQTRYIFEAAAIEGALLDALHKHRRSWPFGSMGRFDKIVRASIVTRFIAPLRAINRDHFEASEEIIASLDVLEREHK